MTIDFDPGRDVAELAERVRRFVRTTVIPAEDDAFAAAHGATDTVRVELQAAARAEGLLSPHVAPEWGGLGLDLRGQSVVFEEAGYSLLGPVALNCAAPDEGNMHLLEVAASDAQRHRWLAPLAAGKIRSCFAMTEPAPGAGSDPTMLRTVAEHRDGAWYITGRKWYITGAVGADLVLCMARTSAEVTPSHGATIFLLDTSTPGFHVERMIGSIDDTFAGGHAEVVFDDCRVDDDGVLGDVDRGFVYAQARLAPARLTHCMRWLGLARRAHDVAVDRALHRESFGRTLSEHGMVQQMVADSEIDIATAHSLIAHAAWVVDTSDDTGGDARHHTSIAKTFVSEAVNRIVDRAVQICGALGVSDDAHLARYLREVRPFRIYDGPSEVHRWAIARRAFRRRAE